MWPVLFVVGPLVIETQSIFAVAAFLAGAFIFWRKTTEEHYQEDQAFDAFLLASIVGLVVGRIGFILLHLNEFSTNILRWFDPVGYPGSSMLFGLLGASIFLYFYAKNHKWDIFEIMDFWFLAISRGMVFWFVGAFFAGTGFGYPTNLPWGVVFPTVFEKHHPVQLYMTLFFLLLSIYLEWAEYHYRTFTWYRAGKKTAQTGFLTSIFLISTGVWMTFMQLLMPAQVIIYGMQVEFIVYGVIAVGGIMLLLNKSGRLSRGTHH